MEREGPVPWSYKINPREQNYLIGPQQVHDLSLSQNRAFALANPSKRRQKRLFEGITSLLMGLGLPALLLFAPRPIPFLKAWYSVFLGKKHWVGYIQKNPTGLPSLKASYLNLLARTKQNRHSRIAGGRTRQALCKELFLVNGSGNSGQKLEEAGKLINLYDG